MQAGDRCQYHSNTALAAAAAAAVTAVTGAVMT